jgi:hypothetical protein
MSDSPWLRPGDELYVRTSAGKELVITVTNIEIDQDLRMVTIYYFSEDEPLSSSDLAALTLPDPDLMASTEGDAKGLEELQEAARQQVREYEESQTIGGRGGTTSRHENVSDK